MQHIFDIWHIPCIMHLPWQSLQFCIDFTHPRLKSIIYYEHVANPPPRMAFVEMTSCAGIFQSLLHAPHSAYMSMRLLPMKTSDSHPLWMICTWALLPSSTAHKLPHMHSTWSEHKCICQDLRLLELAFVAKSSSVFLCCPAFTYLASLLFLGKAVQLYCPRCQCSHLCCHPRGFFLWILKPWSFLKSGVPCTDPQMDQIKLIHHSSINPKPTLNL